MAYTGRYAKLGKADAAISEAGYLRAWITPVANFTTLQDPTIAATPAIGDAYTIGTSHVWVTGKGAIPCYIDRKTLEAAGETSGDSGSLRMKFKPVIFLLGDGAKMQEQALNLMNEECVVHFENSCENPSKVQFGCDCSPAVATKVSFSSGTIEGTDKVGYKLEMESYCKYFYKGAITELS